MTIKNTVVKGRLCGSIRHAIECRNGEIAWLWILPPEGTIAEPFTGERGDWIDVTAESDPEWVKWVGGEVRRHSSRLIDLATALRNGLTGSSRERADELVEAIDAAHKRALAAYAEQEEALAQLQSDLAAARGEVERLNPHWDKPSSGTVAADIIERLESFAAKLESGEPIEVTRITRHETPDGPMHSREMAWLAGVGKGERATVTEPPRVAIHNFYDAFMCGIASGVTGANHKTDCCYATNAFRMWWMQGCIVGGRYRENAKLVERVRELEERGTRLVESISRCTLIKGESATLDIERDYWKLRELLQPKEQPNP